MNDNSKRLLDVQGLKTYFQTEQGTVRAVDDMSFWVAPGRTLGIVGESGCGKSITALSIMHMVPQPRGRIVGGSITYYGREEGPVEITALKPHGPAMRELRGRHMAMIFQEPMTSLTPVYTIGQQIMEAVVHHEGLDKQAGKERAVAMLEKVGISAPRQRVDEYPYQLSGGMRQRAMIAMALSCSPQLLLADEPTTALDVTIQAQIIDLLLDLQQDLGMAIILITHDLGVIGEMAERVLVMYMGKVVEFGSADAVFYRAKHPYTVGLLASIPQIGEDKRLVSIEGSVPSPYNLPRGCYFHTRCPHVMPRCREDEPPSFAVGEGHEAKCWLFAEKEGEVHAPVSN